MQQTFDAHSTGAKREKLNAPRYDYFPARIVNDAYARVADVGAKKYTTYFDNPIEELVHNDKISYIRMMTSFEVAGLAEELLEDYCSEYLRKNTIDGNGDFLVILNLYGNPHSIWVTKSEGCDELMSDVYGDRYYINKRDMIDFSQLLSADYDPYSISVGLTDEQGLYEVDFNFDDDTENFWNIVASVLAGSGIDFKQGRGVKESGAWNWAKGLPQSQIASSLQRHLWSYMEGEDNDPDTGLPHIAHMLWNAVSLVYNDHYGIQDDRFTNIPKRSK